MATVSELTSKNIASAQANVQTWGDIIVNVKVYGAKGDGVTYDTSAIQSAINAVSDTGSGTVFFPIGTYLISANLIVPSNTAIIISKGATIKLIDNAPVAIRMLDCRNSDNIHICGGGIIDGNSTGTQVAEQRTHGIGLTSNAVLIENITIKNITSWSGSMGDGINCEPNITTLKQCENIIIKDCHFDNIDRQDIALESGIHVLIEGNFFKNGGASAVDCEPSGYTIGLIDGVIITNNQCIDKLQGFYVVSALAPTKLQNVTISNNITLNCQEPIRLRCARNIKINGNKFYNSSGTQIIHVYSDGADINADIQIHNNELIGTATNGVYVQAISTGSNENISIENNIVKGISDRALNINTCNGLIVKNNECIGADGALRVVYVNLCSDSLIKNNKITCGTTGNCLQIGGSNDSDIGGNTLLNGDYGIRVQNNNTIYWADNVYRNNAVSKVLDAGGNTLWYGQFSGTFTLTAASQNINDKHVESNSVILLTPTNKDANTLMASTKAAYVNYAGNVVNTSFRVATGDATAPAGTETFRYLIINE